jgi:hypothetical protein
LKTRHGWLVIALALLALIYVIAPRSEPPPSPTRPALDFPSSMRERDHARLEARRTLVPATAAGSAADGGADLALDDVVKNDPLLVALPRAETVVVLEAKALLGSPAGKLFMDCVSEGELPTLEKDGYSMDSLERGAFAIGEGEDDWVMFATGSIAEQAPEALAARELTSASYGKQGQILTRPEGSSLVATWNGEMTMVSESRAALEQAIDRLEGRARQDQPAIEESQSYGDIYGRLSSRAVREVLKSAIPDLSLDESLQLDFHVDGDKDVLLVLDANGAPESTLDLGKTLGAAIAARRVQASLEDDQRLAELLDYFKVDAQLGWFSLNAALPLAFVEEALAECTERAARRRAAKAAAEPGDGGAAPP